MAIEMELFDSLFGAVKGEIVRLMEISVLDRRYTRDGRAKPAAVVLNSIFQEHTLRYLALRSFYERKVGGTATFETEHQPAGAGPIDLILYEGGQEYAFEFKRWQSNEHQIICGKDYANLTAFLGPTPQPHRHAYSLVFTSNDRQGNEDKWNDAKKGYQKDFDDCLGRCYDVKRLEPAKFDGLQLLVCLYLASPKLTGAL